MQGAIPPFPAFKAQDMKAFGMFNLFELKKKKLLAITCSNSQIPIKNVNNNISSFPFDYPINYRK